jgi:hypothetical protein
MMNSPKLLAFAIISLSACGGGGGGEGSGTGGNVVGPEGAFLDGNPNIDYSFNAADNTAQVRTYEPLPQTSSSVITVPAGFTAFTNDDSSVVVFRGVTPSGNGVTTVYSDGGSFLTGALNERLDETILPTTGATTYEGVYAGIFRATNSNEIEFTISGTSRLTVDFDDESISGSISNRIATENDGDSFGMFSLILEETVLSDGAFVETTDGGGFLSAGLAGTQEGRYSGRLVGDNGEEIVGNITVPHTINGSVTGEEVGAFIALD